MKDARYLHSDELKAAIKQTGFPNDVRYDCNVWYVITHFGTNSPVTDAVIVNCVVMHFLGWLKNTTGFMVELFLGILNSVEEYAVCVNGKNFIGASPLQAATKAVNAIYPPPDQSTSEHA